MDAVTVVLTIEALNRMDQAAFTRALGAVFENSPWVAERAWAARPFASLEALHGAMAGAVRAAAPAEQIALLRAHPDLAGKAARAGTMSPQGEEARPATGVSDPAGPPMSASSVAEQASAGLDRLTDEEFDRFTRLNGAYRERFGFPFVIAVRRHDKASILAAFESRLGHTRDQEVAAALAEVFHITRLRLERLLGHA